MKQDAVGTMRERPPTVEPGGCRADQSRSFVADGFE